MSESGLQITRDNNRIIIKKRIDVGTYVIDAIILLAIILLPILFKELRDISLFWGVLIVCMLGSLSSFLSLHFGRIVVDTAKQEIHIYNLCRETYYFDEIKEIKTVFEEGTDGGLDKNKVIIQLKNGYKNEIDTTNTKQSEELAGMLNTLLFPEDNVSCD